MERQQQSDRQYNLCFKVVDEKASFLKY